MAIEYIINYLNLIGRYNGTENDILLLDIINNDEYIWTNSFEPQTTSTTSLATTPTSSSTSPSSPNNKLIMIVIAIGAFIGGISLAFGGAFIYKWNKNKKENKRAIPISGNEVVKDTNHQVLEIPTAGQGIISTTPAINNVYKQNMLPMLPVAENENSTNNEIYNERSSLQNIDVKEVIQVIKQEVMQDLKQELAQNKKHN